MSRKTSHIRKARASTIEGLDKFIRRGTEKDGTPATPEQLAYARRSRNRMVKVLGYHPASTENLHEHEVV